MGAVRGLFNGRPPTDQKKQKKRPYYGGGMPKGHKTAKTISKEQMREKLRLQVAAAQDAMTQAQIAASHGLNLIIVRDAKNGRFLRRIKSEEEFDQAMVAQEEGLETLDVWAKEPSTQAYSYLMDQAIDKPVNPKQELDVTFEDKALRSMLEEGRKRAAARGK